MGERCEPVGFDREGKRRAVVHACRNLFGERGIERMVQRIDRTRVYSQYTVMVDGRPTCQQVLKACGILTALRYRSTSNQPAVISPGTARRRRPHIAQRMMSQTLDAYLSDEHPQRVVDALCATS